MDAYDVIGGAALGHAAGTLVHLALGAPSPAGWHSGQRSRRSGS